MSLFSDVQNFVKKAQGFSGAESFLGGDIALGVPWHNNTQAKNDIFWRPIELDPERWNKLYPYRLLVVDIRDNSVLGEGGTSLFNGTGILEGGGSSESGIEYVITQTAQPGRWEVVLPITPQQLQIQDQFSINTTATMRGIVEEHNGVVFKNIVANGTTGIWPRKPTKAGNISRPSSIGSVLGGTLEAFNQLADNFDRAINGFNGEHPNKAPDQTKPEDTGSGLFSTGYYQALYLGQFLERYAQLKKDPTNKHLRLVFDMPKQNQSFVVTPVAYNFNQNQQKPNEMLYTMQFKAWKRINLKEEVTPNNLDSLPNIVGPNFFQRVNNTIEGVRRTLGSASNLIKAVRGDARGVFDTLRQTSLAVKDLGGLALAIGDLPGQIIEDAKDAIEDAGANIEDAFNRGPGGGGFQAATSSGGVTSNPLTTGATSSSEKAGAVVNAIIQRRNNDEGLSRSAVANGALGDEAAQRLETDPINNVFENPGENFDLFNTIALEDVELTTEQQDAVEDELERIRLLTVDDFRRFKKDMLDLSLEISDNFGSGDDTYSSIYGTPDPRDRSVPLTIEENEVMEAIFEAIQTYDLLTATKQYDDLNEENSLEFVGGLADEANIDFEDFPSKVLAPVPFGSTIEEIAARYMGDPDKWVEIATVNNLRSPYIDEEGFILDLLSNADGRQLNVDDVDGRLYVGQTLIISSDTVPAFTRRIINIEEIGANNFLVTVDGLSNLDNLTTADNAKVQGFLPGTVNSQNQIYIPINAPSQPDDRTFEIPGISEQNLTKISKIDFLLTDSFDVAINDVGDFRLANGLTNLIQALKLKIKTKRGTLLRHLDFGLGLNVGVSVADIENGEVINSLNRTIEGDDRFDFIESATFTLRGSTLAVDLSVRLANNTGVVPINFETRVA